MFHNEFILPNIKKVKNFYSKLKYGELGEEIDKLEVYIK